MPVPIPSSPASAATSSSHSKASHSKVSPRSKASQRSEASQSQQLEPEPEPAALTAAPADEDAAHLEEGTRQSDDAGQAQTQGATDATRIDTTCIDTTCIDSLRIDAMRLIGAVSHEMRNPLNGILGMAHLLSQTDLSPSQRSYLDAIEMSGGLLLTLANDLLDLTALQSGAVAVHATPVSVMQLINQILELEAPRAHGKDLGLGSTVDPALADPILADPARLRQIVSNLVSNAVKFTHKGGVRLDARLESAPMDGTPLDGIQLDGRDAPALVIDVTDTGQGIALADQALIFQPFGRTDAAQASGTEGTGLGLPLSRGLAEAMGGRLDLVASSTRHGTHMRLTVPVALPAGRQGMNARAAASPSALPLGDQHVLLVVTPELAAAPEAQALTATLALLGARTDTVCDAARLSSLQERYDHVLIDIAFDYAVLWGRLNLSALGLRPIMLVRPSQRDRLRPLAEAGFSGYLIRPVRQSSLTAMLTHRFGARPADAFLPDPADTAAANATIARAAVTSAAVTTATDDASPGLDPKQTGPRPDRPTGAIRRILLVDDSPVNALLGRSALESAGHTVELVEDGAKALDAVRTAPPGTYACVVLDLSMPVMGGLDAARALRAFGYEGRLVAVSGTAEPDQDGRAKAAGFDAFGVKPVAPDRLAALVDPAAETGSSTTP